MLSKGQRLELFYEALKKAPRPSNPQESRDTAATVLEQIENKYAPEGEEKMTIPKLEHRFNVPYGRGGIYIPLINGEIHINATGATGFYDCNRGDPLYRLVLTSANGTPFEPVPDFKYPVRY
jgi:hypothetical protein